MEFDTMSKKQMQSIDKLGLWAAPKAAAKGRGKTSLWGPRRCISLRPEQLSFPLHKLGRWKRFNLG